MRIFKRSEIQWIQDAQKARAVGLLDEVRTAVMEEVQVCTSDVSTCSYIFIVPPSEQ